MTAPRHQRASDIFEGVPGCARQFAAPDRSASLPVGVIRPAARAYVFTDAADASCAASIAALCPHTSRACPRVALQQTRTARRMNTYAACTRRETGCLPSRSHPRRERGTARGIAATRTTTFTTGDETDATETQHDDAGFDLRRHRPCHL